MNRILTFFGMLFSGLIGGQGHKWLRRYGIPIIAIIGGKFNKILPYLFIGGVLSIGYGENSILMRILGADGLVRLVYAILLSLPFLFWGMKRWITACIALILSFQVRAGSLGHIGSFDVLIEDIVRYSVLGTLLIINSRGKK